MKEFETVIGLEVHLQFNTESKIFCGCANRFGAPPNSLTCPVCLGLPGTLPVLNQSALQYAIKVALALNCHVNSYIKFDRKNYYYPDLPKGYQISQYDLPIAHNGFLPVIINGQSHQIRIKRAHLEEDAGKLIHDQQRDCSLVDYNRTGTPLMEIVTEPDIHSPQEAYEYLTILKLTLQYLEVSDCDMEKGSLRCDANISLREKGQTSLGTKTELKNLNSFRAVRSALEFEEKRQRQILSQGGTIIQETRLWDESTQTTLSMRTKEEAHDYRYFPEPDLVPFTVEKKEIDHIRQSIPELPAEKRERFIKEYNLSAYDTQILIQDRYLASFFEECAKQYPEIKKICNWINGPLLKELNSRKIAFRDLGLSPKHFISLIQKVEEGTISNLVGKEVLAHMLETKAAPEAIIQGKGLAQLSDAGALEKIVNEVISENPKVVTEIQNGKESAIGFLVGQTMKKSQGKANPKIVGTLIKKLLLK